MGYLYRPKLKNGKLGKNWWIQYFVNGKRVRESTDKTKESEAKHILKQREGRVASGQPFLPRVDRILYDELAADLLAHYKTTGKRAIGEVEDRLDASRSFFKGRRACTIWTSPHPRVRGSTASRKDASQCPQGTGCHHPREEDNIESDHQY